MGSKVPRQEGLGFIIRPWEITGVEFCCSLMLLQVKPYEHESFNMNFQNRLQEHTACWLTLFLESTCSPLLPAYLHSSSQYLSSGSSPLGKLALMPAVCFVEATAQCPPLHQAQEETHHQCLSFDPQQTRESDVNKPLEGQKLRGLDIGQRFQDQ